MEVSTETATNQTNIPSIHLTSEWMQTFSSIGYAITTIIWILTAWILTSLSFFFNKQFKVRTRRHELSKTLVILALSACVFSLTTTSLRYGELAIRRYISASTAGNFICEVFIDMCTVFYSIAFLLTNLFLWYRVKLLYSMQLVKRLETKLLKNIHRAVLVLFILGALVYVVAYIYPQKYELHATIGCFKRDKVNAAVFSDIMKYATLVLVVLANVALFLLLCYPLRQLEKRAKLRKGKKNPSVLRALRYAFGSLLICVLSDCFDWLLLGNLSPAATPVNFRMAIWDFNLFLNIISMVVCFEMRKAIFLGAWSYTPLDNWGSSIKRSTRTIHIPSDSVELKAMNGPRDGNFK